MPHLLATVGNVVRVSFLCTEAVPCTSGMIQTLGQIQTKQAFIALRGHRLIFNSGRNYDQ